MRNNYITKFLIPILFHIWIVLITVATWSKPVIVSQGDTFFHASRILSMRSAFLTFELPNWVAFDTFHHVGSAIPAMYPDILLWPLVIITLGFNFIHQILLIRVLTVLITFWSAYSALRKGFKQDNYTLVGLLSVLYATTGYALHAASIEFQPNAALVYAIAPWLTVITIKFITTKDTTPKYAILLALLLSLVLNLHLLSIIVWGIIVAPFALFQIIKNRKISLLINGALAILIMVGLSLPFLYRFYLIKTSDILPPFGIGHATGQTLKDFLVYSSMWSSRKAIALPWIIMVVFCAIYLKSKLNRLNIYYITALVWAAFLTTTLAPLSIFNAIPILDSLQHTPWRFGPFLPVIILLIIGTLPADITKKFSTITLYSFAFASLALSSITMLNSIDPTKLIISELTAKSVQGHLDYISQAELRDDSLNQTIIPDYAPNGIGTRKNDDSRLSKFGEQLNKNHVIKTPNATTRFTVKHFASNTILLNVQSSTDSNKSLVPVYGYNKLSYKVKLNNHPVKYSIDKSGLLKLCSQVNKGDKITVSLAIPNVYYALFLISTLVFVAIIIAYKKIV